jgi:hypothetical protein
MGTPQFRSFADGSRSRILEVNVTLTEASGLLVSWKWTSGQQLFPDGRLDGCGM